MTSFLLMMTADSCARRRDSPCNEKVKPQITPKVAVPKVSKGRSRTSSVSIALWSPPQRRNPLLAGKELLCLKDRQVGRAHLARHSTDVGKSSLGALLRKRKVTGRDASLPAPLLTFPLEWSPVEQLGRCPKPHKGRCPLTLQGALPLDPFWAARLGCVRLTALTCCLYPKSALHMTRCPGRHRAPPSPSNPVSDPHTRGLSPPESSHCPTISAGTSQF